MIEEQKLLQVIGSMLAGTKNVHFEISLVKYWLSGR
jgi:hypothetical protein